jgi:hypothetical protein
MKLLLLLAFSTLLPLAWAKDPTSHRSLSELLEDIRDPLFKSSDRLNILNHSRSKMAQLLGRELKVKPDELNRHFVTHQTKLQHLYQGGWYDLQTQFYTTLHQESFHQKWLRLQQQQKISSYGQNIADAMISHLGTYSPVKEGRFYFRWSNISVALGGRNREFQVPFFLMANTAQDLLKIEAHVPYEELFPSHLTESRLQPRLQTFVKRLGERKREEYQILGEKLVLIQKSYVRAVANAAKTVASFHYLTGDKSRSQTQQIVKNFLATQCADCLVKEREDALKAAMLYVDSKKPEMVYPVANLAELSTTLCTSLKEHGYQFNAPKDKKISATNHAALLKTIHEQDLGLIFLTKAMNHLDNAGEPTSTKLNCTQPTSASNVSLLRSAIQEAQENIEKYTTDLNERVVKSYFSNGGMDRVLQYLVQTNPAAVTEASMVFPQGINHIMATLQLLDKNIELRRKVDEAVCFGSLIIGLGLVVSGVGTPQGVAMLIGSTLVWKGVIGGVYFIARGAQERNFLKGVQIARKGTKVILSDANLRMHYHDYRRHRIEIVKEFASSIIFYNKFFKAGLMKMGDPAKVNNAVKNIIFKAKAGGWDFTDDQIQDHILELIVS